jgi:hypothetical protein
MNEAAAVVIQDSDLTEQGVIAVQYDNKSVAITVSLKSYGDIGAVITKQAAKKLKDALRKTQFVAVRSKSHGGALKDAPSVKTRDLATSGEVYLGIRYDADNVYIFFCLTLITDVELVITKSNVKKLIDGLTEATSSEGN